MLEKIRRQHENHTQRLVCFPDRSRQCQRAGRRTRRSFHSLRQPQSVDLRLQPDGQQGLWIQDARKDWFYAKLQGPCMGLEFAPRLGFEPKTNNVLDRFGTVVVPNQARCQITSLTKSAAPADEKKTRKPDAK